MASSSATTLLELMEPEMNHQQEVLRILTSMNNELAALNRNVVGSDGAVGRNSSVNISNNQIQTFNFNSTDHEIEGPADEVGNNPASDSEQQGNSLLRSTVMLLL